MKNGEDGERSSIERWMPELQAHALECLLSYCTAEKPRLQYAAKGYVKRAIQKLAAEGMTEDDASLRERLETLICDEVTADEMRTRELVARTDWEKAILVAVAVTVKNYGTKTFDHDRLFEYVQEAIEQLLDRGRRMPHEKKVTVTNWLVQTVRSRIAHDLRKARNAPKMLRIITDRSADQAQGEVSEDQLPAVAQDTLDEEDDDGDHRRPRLEHPHLPAGLHRYGRGPSA